MKELYSLLFELSNEDRLNILRELKNNPMKLSRVSEKFNFTVPETSRNMTRLTEANLITKNTDGIFHLTPMGEDVLLLLPSFEFISRNDKYFKTHPLSFLPSEYSSVTARPLLLNTKNGALPRKENLPKFFKSRELSRKKA